ncbi:DUF2235 domain-containing protein [Mucilaginibacter sp. ZT4R22]|uniref:DUF2235 domain-containing protein n=1 Tax=Mucilaginibacter pankratovii TaxID=2772110 RepID=A0ABR7WQI4_9SPHI|nr:DUF2235 domain-containing protein [Mucilaginibacter pankratovii]MBD1364586.1 DUF2235 domain-containing protein [Mucilaginibacter pankratovii]
MDKIRKRIITCSDGTWNKPGDVDGGVEISTNVQKIFEGICNEDDAGIKQIKYYDQGVGSTGSKLRRIIDGATGYGLDENILDAYKFIIWNYEQGDEIYLFGFSRGAYTARSLAGMIRKVGLLKNNDLKRIKEAYALYRDSNIRPGDAAAVEFRNTYSQPYANVKFIGVWDTVGSLGIPFMVMQNKRKYQFHDTTLSSHVDFAYHALAVDEQRKNFMPTLWRESENVAEKNPNQKMEQRWFPGVHSNIGGGYPKVGLSDVALKWMIDKAADAGLAFEKRYLDEKIKPNDADMLYNSNKFPFSLLGKHVRKIKELVGTNETIDESVFERMLLDFRPEPLYKPANVKSAHQYSTNSSSG